MDFLKHLQSETESTPITLPPPSPPPVTYKRGDLIKIVRFEKSVYNSYKGYTAEIYDAKRNDGFAMVLVHTNYPKLIKLPLEHFKKLDCKRS